MTLGEIIKEYTSEHTMSEFLEKSGLSKAYAYMLIKNKNNAGEPIAPSLSTIQKVANGIGKPFTDVFSRLDNDSIVKVKSKVMKRSKEEQEIIDRISSNLSSMNNEKKQEEHAYYLNEETAKIAQEVFDNPNTRMLFDAARGARPEDIQMAAEMLRRFKETNHDI